MATSSGMAEHYAMCLTAEELLRLRSILKHFGFRVNTTLFCDSVAARDIAQRAGLEKVKALAVQTFWLQEVVRGRGLQIKSISSKASKADFGTKVFLLATLSALRAPCGIVVLGGMLSENLEDENDDG